MVRDLLMGDSGAQRSVNEPQRLLRDADDFDRLSREHGELRAYIDPVLGNSRHHYLAFCRRMLSVGLRKLCLRMREAVGILFA